MPKKLLKHGKFFTKDPKTGDLVVYRAGAVVNVTDNQAKNSPDQFVDLPLNAQEESKPEIVKEGKPSERAPDAAKKTVA